MLALAGDVYITRSLLVYGEYCPAEARMLAQIVAPGMTVIEAGANMGTHTVALARGCAPGTLYAFEPQQRVFQILCANLALNDIGNVCAFPEGCGAEAGWANIPELDYAASGDFGGVSLNMDAPRSRRVRVTTIDSLALEACGLIKVDVEGWEAEVLKGAAETIARCRPILYVENDRRDRQGELIDLIAGMGYRQYWHTPPLFSPDNFNGVPQDIFGPVASCNMLCIPRERPEGVEGIPEIDPENWTSPMRPPEVRP
jgi:FkbM family methyltransferase